MTGTPNDVNPGWVCRIRLGGGGIVYTSARHQKDTAVAIAHAFERTVEYSEGGPLFVEFPTDSGPVKVRADKITAIEAVPVTPARWNGAAGYETRPAAQAVTRR